MGTLRFHLKEEIERSKAEKTFEATTSTSHHPESKKNESSPNISLSSHSSKPLSQRQDQSVIS
jgi:hypothetical protein